MGGRRTRVLGGTLAGLLALALLAVFGLASSGQVTGRRAPGLPRERLAGGGATLKSLLAGDGGRPVLVTFWASWCKPCEQEAPALERFSRTAAGRGRLVAVDWSDPLVGDARSFVRRYGWSFPVLRDAEGTVGNEYRLGTLPSTFVIDGDGRIHRVLHGPQTPASLGEALAAAERS